MLSERAGDMYFLGHGLPHNALLSPGQGPRSVLPSLQRLPVPAPPGEEWSAILSPWWRRSMHCLQMSGINKLSLVMEIIFIFHLVLCPQSQALTDFLKCFYIKTPPLVHTHARMHAHTCTHTQASAHKHADCTKLNLHNLKQAPETGMGRWSVSWLSVLG